MKWTKPHGPAQEEFIRTTRSAIDANPKDFFKGKDWRHITPNAGRYSILKKQLDASSFCIKPVAAWVPHLIIPGFRPSCPHCKTPEHVDVNNSRWISKPRTLHGIRSHHCLDTKLYHCLKYKKHFTGHNKDLMSNERDANQLMGLFNFQLARTFALDEDACGAIVNSSSALFFRNYCNCRWTCPFLAWTVQEYEPIW